MQRSRQTICLLVLLITHHFVRVLHLCKNIGNEGTKIYIGNLNFATTQEDLEAAFAEYGEIKDCFLPTDYDGNPRGFAFISMAEADALKAIEEMNGTEFDGRTLNVNKSLPKGQKATPKRKFWNAHIVQNY